MKLNFKKHLYLLLATIILTMIFTYQANSNYNLDLDQETAPGSSGKLSIPVCSDCNSISEPTCSGTTSPQCPNDDSDLPSCKLVGNVCSPSCPGTVQDPNTGFPIPATPFCNTKYLIIDGDGAGITVFSTSDNPSKIFIPTSTDGSIKEADEQCPGTNSYFTGTLLGFVFNSLAPDPPCGWGHVVIFKKLPERLSLMSKIVASTKNAYSNADAFFHSAYGIASNEVIYYSNKLIELKNLIVKSKDIKSKKKKMILRKIELILKQTEIAKSNLSSLADAESNFVSPADMDPNQSEAARVALTKANDYEVEIFKILLQFDVIK